MYRLYIYIYIYIYIYRERETDKDDNSFTDRYTKRHIYIVCVCMYICIICFCNQSYLAVYFVSPWEILQHVPAMMVTILFRFAVFFDLTPYATFSLLDLQYNFALYTCLMFMNDKFTF